MAGIEASMTLGGVADGGTYIFAWGLRHARSDTIGVNDVLVIRAVLAPRLLATSICARSINARSINDSAVSSGRRMNDVYTVISAKITPVGE
jgi:hypothetical protein